MIYDMFVFWESEIFSNFQNGLKSDYFAKIAYKIAKSKYFWWFGLFLFFLKLLVGGGAPRTAAYFYSAKLCGKKNPRLHFGQGKIELVRVSG